MTGLEITLIIIGFACICISFFAARKKEDGEADGDEQARTSAVWTEKEEKMIRERVNRILSDCQDEVVDATEERMNRICNEKIMAIDEFSKPLLEKIENNHQEVVFMYNMLNEKQKEIKKIMTETVRAAEPAGERAPAAPASAEPSALPEREKKEPQTAIERMQARGKTAARSTTDAALKKEVPAASPGATDDPKNTISGSVNLQIRKMYKEGKSILQISRELNIGQGEVKLVIALYGDQRN